WWPFAITTYQRFWRSTNSQEVDSFSNGITGKIEAFRSGGHFTVPWLKFSETINFKSDEIPMSAKDEDAHLFSTSDPYQCALDWQVVGKPIDTPEGIKRYLR